MTYILRTDVGDPIAERPDFDTLLEMEVKIVYLNDVPPFFSVVAWDGTQTYAWMSERTPIREDFDEQTEAIREGYQAADHVWRVDGDPFAVEFWAALLNNGANQ